MSATNNQGNDELIARAERWLARLRPSDTGANGPMFTRLLLEALKARPSEIGQTKNADPQLARQRGERT